MFYTIYCVENLVNGKLYVGKHITDNLDDSYFGSGKLIKKALSKYRKEQFQKHILFVFDNEHDMNQKESELVNDTVVESPDFYNIALGGKGGCIVLRPGHPLRESTIEKIKQSRTLEMRQGISERNKELHQSKTIGMHGRSHYDETRQKISQSHVGKKHTADHVRNHKNSLKETFADPNYIHPNTGKVHSLETRKKISENHADVSGSNNPNYGKMCSEETRKKISAKAKERNKIKHSCEYCGKPVSKTNYIRWHGSNCKLK